MNPRIITGYKKELFSFISKEEGISLTVYACSQHVPTIGIGYALLEKSGGHFRIRSDLDEDLSNVGKTLTKADKIRLVNVCEKLNNGTVTEIINGSKFNDAFDLRLNRDEIENLLEICLKKYEAILKNRLGLKLYKQFQNSKEMVTLLSLAYNAPGLIGTELVQALSEGNRAKVQYQILYRSNKNLDAAIVTRRKHEAEEFGRYDGEMPTHKELMAEAEVRSAYSGHISAYTASINKRDKAKVAKTAKSIKTSPNMNRTPKPGVIATDGKTMTKPTDVKVRSHRDGRRVLDRVKELFRKRDKVTYRDWSEHPAGFEDQFYHKRWS